MRIVFMGTPDFAVPSLHALTQSGHEIIEVVTQPDKPKGRGFHLTPPPVKTAALELGLSVYQPVGIKGDEAINHFRALAPDLIVVVAYGEILSCQILSLPRYGCINVHASLLPKYRGAAPIQWAIAEGEEKTGVTTMLMNEGLDTGDMLLAAELPIGSEETAQQLHDRLSILGAQVLLQTLNDLQAGILTPVAQDDELACYAPMINRQSARIDFSRSAQEIKNLVRAMQPWPVAFTHIGEQVLKVHDAEVVEQVFGLPGEVVDCDPLLVATGDGNGLRLKQVQLEGRKRMAASDFVNGYALEKGTILQ